MRAGREINANATQFSRLIGGGKESSRTSLISISPQQRLSRFKQTYERLLNTFQKSQPLHNDEPTLESVRLSIARLTSILHDESRSSAPHLSLSFAASAHIYVHIARIASAVYNESVIREAVAFFSALMDSEEEELLAHERFSLSLMGFVDRFSGGANNVFVGEETEVEIVELLFGIAAKIRLQPEILPVWFRQRTTQSILLEKEREKEKQGFAGVTQKEDFPLCYQLIDRVHHGGRIGDFARTGLLYVFESASKSNELEQWLVESDIPTMMATGLGALYSQLSRKLSIVHPRASLPIVLVLSDYAETKGQAPDAESFFSESLKMHINTFLSYLTFWQDVLEHCNSVDVRQTLLDHFQVLFLQQLLYPSLLESSDADGGSSVAVLTYLRIILEAVEHPELIHGMLQYLLAMPEPMTSSSPRLVQRRESLMLLSKGSQESDQLDPSLFSLIDLILNSLRSGNHQTVTAALRLISVILSKNHAYAVGTLIKVATIGSKDVLRTHGSLIAEMEAYLELAKTTGDSIDIDNAYENHLKDASKLLESHTCSTQLLKLDELGFGPKRANPSLICVREPTPHRLNPDDSMFRFLLYNLESFLTNNVEVNLGLTESIITLASCGHLRLEGWVSVEPSKYVFADGEAKLEASVQSINQSTSALNDLMSVEKDPVQAMENARRRPNWYRSNSPPLLTCLNAVHKELTSVRSAVPDFDVLLGARRQAFNLYEAISDAISNASPLLPPSKDPPPLPPQSQQNTAEPEMNRLDKILADYERTITGSPSAPSKPEQKLTKGFNLARRVLADYERSIGGEGAAGGFGNETVAKGSIRPHSTGSQTPRSQSKSKPPPATPSKQQKGLGSYGLIGPGSPSAKKPQSRSRSQSRSRAQPPMSGAWTPNKDSSAAADGKDHKDLLNDVIREADAEILKRRFQFPAKRALSDEEKGDDPSSDTSSVASKEQEQKDSDSQKRRSGDLREASLSHILTNAVILQEFELELVAIMQVRASMFDEVRFV